MQELQPHRLSISLQLTLSFILVALVGSVILYLPVFHQPGVEASYFDHLITSISLVCVSGMASLSLFDTYNLAGQWICLLLIQVGGLGIVTIMNLGLSYLYQKIPLHDQYLVQASFNLDSNAYFATFLKSIFRFTLLFEGIGALCLLVDFIPRFGWGHGIFNALFISVSAFSNAGFHNFNANSLEGFSHNGWVLGVISSLVIAGSIGFPVWFELLERAQKMVRERPHSFRLNFRRVSIHTRLVLQMTVFLLVTGTVMFWFVESQNPNTLQDHSAFHQWMNSFFASANARTAGFISVDYASLRPFSKFSSMVLTMIGGAPGGTAGGLKVTTAAVLVMLFRSELHSYSEVVYAKRTIPSTIVKRAVVIIIFFIAMLSAGFGLLLLTQPHLNALDLMFETVNALGTSGISLNLSNQLTHFGHWVLSVLMIAGRVGPITLLMGVLERRQLSVRYADGHILLG